jgi:tubulin gamma
VSQYDRLRKSGAFLNVYRKEAMFADSLDEFDDARETVMELIDEYKACESPDYANYGLETEQKANKA